MGIPDANPFWVCSRKRGISLVDGVIGSRDCGPFHYFNWMLPSLSSQGCGSPALSIFVLVTRTM